MIIREIDYDLIYNLWQTRLWPERVSEIKPISCIQFDGSIDLGIKKLAPPIFLGAYIDHKLVGVNSGHPSTDDHFRSRGLYVLPSFRKQGVGQLLLEEVGRRAQELNYKYLWSLPRLSASSIYQNAGFSLDTNKTQDLEFGPNIFAIKQLWKSHNKTQ